MNNVQNCERGGEVVVARECWGLGKGGREVRKTGKGNRGDGEDEGNGNEGWGQGCVLE